MIPTEQRALHGLQEYAPVPHLRVEKNIASARDTFHEPSSRRLSMTFTLTGFGD